MSEIDLLRDFQARLGAGEMLSGNLEWLWQPEEKQKALQTGPARCKIIPFIAGRRPTDEAAYPSLGSSDSAIMLLGGPADLDNRAYILFRLDGLAPYLAVDPAGLALDVSLDLIGPDGKQPPRRLPGWDNHPWPFQIFEQDATTREPILRSLSAGQIQLGQHLALELVVGRDLLPALAALARPDDENTPFGFGQLFVQWLRLTLRLTFQGQPVTTAQTWLDVCDTRQFGSLYRRIIERIIGPDTARQFQAAERGELDPAYHPWFPVLLIGSDKAALYTQALVEDIVHKKRHLTDPRWLMRVGVYLEFLTCLGIFEAVKDELGYLLSPAERQAFEQSQIFSQIRQYLNPVGWRKVWELRQIAFPRAGLPRTGPVSVLNLLRKKKATLAFLETHHQDLKHALELAGLNVHNSQETWHRVFRDAERAVLRQTPAAFPELGFLPAWLRSLTLWHRGRWPGGLDGLFAAACNQYRASMNEVAEWARHRGLMDYTGSECVPTEVSLLKACMGKQPARFEQLQRRDGYKPAPAIDAGFAYISQTSPEQLEQLLSEVPLFAGLPKIELTRLAGSMRKIELGPMERIIIQGRAGLSLFVIGEGCLEVLVRQADGNDRPVAQKRRGDLVGELAFLANGSRTATVRALEGAVVYEISKRQYGPLLQTHPELLAALKAGHAN